MDYLYILIAFILCIVGFVYLNDPIRKYSHIPGPQRKSFFTGNNNELSTNPSYIHKVWTKKYGPVYKCFIGLCPLVFVSSPELLREVFITKFENFVNRSLHPGIITNVEGILFAKDDAWKKLRRTITPAFNTIHLKAMIPMMIKNTDSFIDLLDNYSKTSEKLDIDNAFSQVTLQIIGSTAFGEDLSVQNSSNTEFLQSVNAYMTATDPNLLNMLSALPNLVRLLFFAFIKKFPPKAVVARFKGEKYIRNKVDQIVKKKKSEKNLEEDNFISTIVNCKDNETGKPLTDIEIRDTSLTFLLAGHETTKHLLSMTIYISTLYPHVLAKMVEEIDKFFPDYTFPTDFEDLKYLSYTSMVLNEVLRMYPPVPLVSRQNNVDMEIGGYFIPAHTKVWIPVLSVHMNPQIWGEDVEKFHPSRWLDPPKDQLSFLPFGAGNRNCIGMRFALMEAKILIVRVFQRFIFELVEGRNQIPPVIEEGQLTNRLKNGLWVKVLRRRG